VEGKSAMQWHLSNRADKAALPLVDRHYSRQKVGAYQFMPTGSCIVFLTGCGCAVWGTSFPLAQYTKHDWAGAWVNSLFRNEGVGLSSSLIIEAVAATRAFYGEPPSKGMVTFVDPNKVKPKRVPGWCYRQAGFRHAGFTKGGLWVWQMLPCEMPLPCPANSRSVRGLPLFDIDYSRVHT
jgi:hypothetical protein